MDLPAALLYKDHHCVLENTSCSVLVVHVQLMAFTIEGPSLLHIILI
jgi:hypothetical protein